MNTAILANIEQEQLKKEKPVDFKIGDTINIHVKIIRIHIL